MVAFPGKAGESARSGYTGPQHASLSTVHISTSMANFVHTAIRTQSLACETLVCSTTFISGWNTLTASSLNRSIFPNKWKGFNVCGIGSRKWKAGWGHQPSSPNDTPEWKRPDYMCLVCSQVETVLIMLCCPSSESSALPKDKCPTQC